MCCGVGNLEVKHSNPRNIFMSTLDEADIDVMKATKTCVAAERFQYDYLNDDIDDFGQIDYSLTNKIPESLRKAIKEGKKILVLINPPYAEATTSSTVSGTGENKAGVAKTKFALTAMDGYGKASNELFTQFIARIAQEIPTATLAIFSKLKYVNAPNFEEFRNTWNGVFLGGFAVHSKAFDGLKGDFPIGFLIWKTNQEERTPIEEISLELLDKKVQPIGNKSFYNLPTSNYLNLWIDRPKANKQEVIPLKNAISPTTSEPRVRTWSDGAIGYMCSGTNDFQNTNMIYLMSSVASRGNGFYITPSNLLQAASFFTATKIIKPSWINDRDQFLQPSQTLTEEFKNNALVWMLFNSSNLTAGARDLDWNGKQWSLVNHFIPFTEVEVGSPERFESDFMAQYISNTILSTEAQAVLDAGRELWKAYLAETDVHAVREEFKLNRSDVGWYQIRNALTRRNESGDYPPIDFTPFETAYEILGAKLKPLVYELGFLK